MGTLNQRSLVVDMVAPAEAEMGVYWKDGYLEAVLFIFLRDQHILVEHRPTPEGTETFIPNGKIEEADLLGSNDYRITAMMREVAEEFGNQVALADFVYIGEYSVSSIQIKFYGYLITQWIGNMPQYTIEEGSQFSDLEWVPISESQQYLHFDSALYFVEKAAQLLGTYIAKSESPGDTMN